MNRKAQFIAGFVIMLMLPGAWSQTTPTSFMAVPGDGRATLRWDSVPNATGYNVKQVTSAAGPRTVIATNVAESSFVITNLVNGAIYSFAVSAIADVFQSADTPGLRTVPSAPVLDLLPAGAKLEKLVTGLQFPEGPVWIPEKEGYLIFCDVDGNAMYRWSPTAGKTVFRKPSNSSCGNTLDLQGRLLTCEPQAGRVVRTESDGTVTPLVTRYNGDPFNGPNDIVVKSDGTIWFTDPVSTDRGWKHQPGPAVFRFDPATQQITPVATNFTASANEPNGLCFSPDESTLYLVDTLQSAILAYDVLADGTLTNNRIFAQVGTVVPLQYPDGIRCDRAGRIFCTLDNAGTRSGVRIYDPNGQLLGTILTPDFLSNVCFGGSNQEMIFLTAGDGVYGITRMPDLIVTALNRIPANPTAGQPVTFSATVKNQGTGPTPNGVATLVAFSVDGATNIVWSDGFTASIPPDASVILTANAGVAGSTWPATAGSHSIRARVDDLGRIAESNETNNVRSATLTVSAPPPDNDGDGLDDASEALAGTDAKDGTSVLKILAAERPTDDRLALTWSSVPGKSYRIARKSNLVDLQWASSVDVIPATGAATSWTNSVPINGKPAFFRILVIQ